MLVVHTSLQYLHFPNRTTNGYVCCVSGLFASSSNTNTTRMGPVVVYIDNAIVNNSGVEFEYRDDPAYSSASPQMIIPA